jgi:hypothetical protein
MELIASFSIESYNLYSINESLMSAITHNRPYSASDKIQIEARACFDFSESYSSKLAWYSYGKFSEPLFEIMIPCSPFFRFCIMSRDSTYFFNFRFYASWICYIECNSLSVSVSHECISTVHEIILEILHLYRYFFSTKNLHNISKYETLYIFSNFLFEVVMHSTGIVPVYFM